MSAPEVGDPSIAGFAPVAPVWFQWTAPLGYDGEVELDTVGSVGTNGVILDTVLAVFTGSSLSTLSQVAANDDLYPTTPAVQVNESGQNIWNTNAVLLLSGYTYVYSNFTYILIPSYTTNYAVSSKGSRLLSPSRSPAPAACGSMPKAARLIISRRTPRYPLLESVMCLTRRITLISSPAWATCN